MSEVVVEVRQVMAGDPLAVFDAWTDPYVLRTCLGVNRAVMDLRVGGRWTWDWTPEGNDPNPCGGEYLVVEPGKRLEFSWVGLDSRDASTGETRVSVQFHPVEGGTEVALRHELHNEAQLDDYTRGWTGSLGALADYFRPPA